MLKDKDKADDKKKQAVRQRAKVKSEGAAPLPDHMDREKTKAFKLSKESDELRKEMCVLCSKARARMCRGLCVVSCVCVCVCVLFVCVCVLCMCVVCVSVRVRARVFVWA